MTLPHPPLLMNQRASEPRLGGKKLLEEVLVARTPVSELGKAIRRILVHFRAICARQAIRNLRKEAGWRGEIPSLALAIHEYKFPGAPQSMVIVFFDAHSMVYVHAYVNRNRLDHDM